MTSDSTMEQIAHTQLMSSGSHKACERNAFPWLLGAGLLAPQQHMRFSATHPPTYFPPEPDTLKGWVLAGQEREREGSKRTELHPSPGPACGHRSSLLHECSRILKRLGSETQTAQGKENRKRRALTWGCSRSLPPAVQSPQHLPPIFIVIPAPPCVFQNF